MGISTASEQSKNVIISRAHRSNRDIIIFNSVQKCFEGHRACMHETLHLEKDVWRQFTPLGALVRRGSLWQDSHTHQIPPFVLQIHLHPNSLFDTRFSAQCCCLLRHVTPVEWGALGQDSHPHQIAPLVLQVYLLPETCKLCSFVSNFQTYALCHLSIKSTCMQTASGFV